MRRPTVLAPLLAALTAVAVLLGGCGDPPAGIARTLALPAGSVPPPGNADGTSTPVADPVYPAYGNPALDVLRYGLVLSWAPDTRVLTGQATLKLRAVTAVPAVQLDLATPYTIQKISVDGVVVPGRVAGGKLTVDRALAAGASATLVVEYRGTPGTVPMPSHRPDVEPLGLTVTADGGLWTMQEPYGASTWYPANDQPSDKALYDISITVPAGWQAVASGTPAGQDGGTYKYTTSQPVATYLTTLAVGHYRREQLTGPHDLPITVWTRAADERFLPQLRKAPDQLRWLEAKFGRYPFPSAGAVVVPSRSAMETQQMVTLGGDVLGDAKDTTPIESIMLHEYAHQWFGDAVGPASWKDVWLNEGWASYAEALYRAEQTHTSIEAWAQRARDADAEARDRLGPPGNPRADSFAESNVYVCPALMLYTLHQQLGDTAFYALARAWVAERAGTAQTRAGFVAFVNRQTGRDFTALIDAWLDSPTTPPA